MAKHNREPEVWRRVNEWIEAIDALTTTMPERTSLQPADTAGGYARAIRTDDPRLPTRLM